MAKIKQVRALEILDSRGFPTVQADVVLDDGTVGSAAVPSGASTGEHEAVELRDGDKARYFGKGVLKAVGNVNGELNKFLAGKDPSKQVELDRAMIQLDGSDNKGRLGANALLACSLAIARASAGKKPLYAHLRSVFGITEKEWLLPAPMFNVINGGKHADSGLDVQEFMVVPIGAPSFKEAMRAGAEIYQALKKKLSSMNMTVAVGDEGGFAPQLSSHAAALEVLMGAVGAAGWDGKVKPAMDAASSEFYRDGNYVFEKLPRSAEQMARIYGEWIKKFGLISLEDPLAEDDWEGWNALTDALGGQARLVGDDLFVTNVKRLERGIKEGVGNSILIKVNQIGTLTETVDTVRMAQKAGYSSIISHRSGETEDAFIADLAVALNAGAIKTGAPCRSERLAKYNRLLQIEAELNSKASYAGDFAFTPAKTAKAVAGKRA